MQDRDEIVDHGPDADGREESVQNEAPGAEEEDEPDGEDLLDDNMYECASEPAS
jgi:hypothetical protein